MVIVLSNCRRIHSVNAEVCHRMQLVTGCQNAQYRLRRPQGTITDAQ